MTIPQPPSPGPDIWTVGGPWRFSRELVVTGSVAESLYPLYRRAFNPLRTRAAARHLMTKQDFLDQMSDERLDKYLVWEDESDLVGVITLTQDLRAIPWISPEFYAARYPDQWARNAIYYLVYMLISPGVRRTGFLETVTRLLIEPMVAERAVLAYDLCSYNDEALGFSTLISETMRMHSPSQPQELDSQIYYGIDFA